jgi:AcrR family transcriptional regulator
MAMTIETEKTSTKQKILESAIDLFALKGYTETSVRELAAAVGVKEASLYNHFPSKNAILDYILSEYAQLTIRPFGNDQLAVIKENPTADSILSCMTLVFPEGKESYYLKELYVILQEQHRNPIVGKFVSEHLILGNEQIIKSIVESLKEAGILKPSTNPDFWATLHSCMLYTFASRLMLGIGDSSPGFTGLSMEEMLNKIYDMMIKTCSNSN